jgi:putative ABC transport system permease protein
MKYLLLIRKNITRKKTRMLLTLGSFAVALFLYGLLTTINNAFYVAVDVAGADRLIIRNKTSLIMPLPYAYKEKIRQISGVKEVTAWSWFGGIYQDERNFFPQFAVESEDYIKIYPEYVIPEGQWDTYLKDRQGCVVGRRLAKKFGWKIGDRIPLKGTIYTGIWEFNICGIFDNSRQADDTGLMFFHYKYLDEKKSFDKGMVGAFVLKIDNPDNGERIVEAIDKRFANSAFETDTETEQVFQAGFIKQMGNIKLIILMVGAVVFFTLLLVTGSTMAMAVRERTNEIGVLKTLGYSDLLVLGLVLAESVLYALVGGVLGLGMAKLFTLGGDPTGGMLRAFFLSAENIATGLVITLVIGSVSGLVPAIQAMRLNIVEALRRV